MRIDDEDSVETSQTHRTDCQSWAVEQLICLAGIHVVRHQSIHRLLVSPFSDRTGYLCFNCFTWIAMSSFLFHFWQADRNHREGPVFSPGSGAPRSFVFPLPRPMAHAFNVILGRIPTALSRSVPHRSASSHRWSEEQKRRLKNVRPLLRAYLNQFSLRLERCGACWLRLLNICAAEKRLGRLASLLSRKRVQSLHISPPRT